MIDSLTILVTSGAILFVVVRALMLDRSLPWFTTVAKTEPDGSADRPPPQKPGWRTRSAGMGSRRSEPAKPPWRSR